MTEIVAIHPDNPQKRLLRQVVEVLEQGGVIVYPTDSAYALGCHVGDKNAMERIRQLRELNKKHNFTLMCKDLSELATYARVNNSTYRLLKANTPGPYTFILQATKEVPRRLQHPKRKTIGLRIPANNIALGILEELAEPLMSSTLLMPGAEMPLSDPDDICAQLEGRIDLLVDGGFCGIEPTTVVDLVAEPTIIRHGKGDTTPFEI